MIECVIGTRNYHLQNLTCMKYEVAVKNLHAHAEVVRDMGLIPGSGRSPGEGNGNPLQYSCLENPMDRGSWWATVHRVAKSQTRLKLLGIRDEIMMCPY